MKMQISTICLGLLLVATQSFAQNRGSIADRDLTEGKIAAAEDDASLVREIQTERSQIQSLIKSINFIHDRITEKVMNDQDASGGDEGSLGFSPMKCSGQILFISEDVIRGLRSLKKTTNQSTLASYQKAKVQLQKNLLSMQDCERM